MDAMIRQVLVRNGITFINDPNTARAIDTLAYSAAEANIRLTAQSATL